MSIDVSNTTLNLMAENQLLLPVFIRDERPAKSQNTCRTNKKDFKVIYLLH